jgi:hypothetical protein
MWLGESAAHIERQFVSVRDVPRRRGQVSPSPVTQSRSFTLSNAMPFQQFLSVAPFPCRCAQFPRERYADKSFQAKAILALFSPALEAVFEKGVFSNELAGMK